MLGRGCAATKHFLSLTNIVAVFLLRLNPVTSHSSQHASAEPPADEMSALVALFNQGQYAVVESKIKVLIARFPRSGFCYKTVGAVFRQQGKLPEALNAMRQAAMLLPNDAVAQHNLAILLKQQGYFVEAEASYKKVLAHDSQFIPAQLGLGQVLQAQKKFQAAELSYRQALKIKPDSLEVFNRLAELFAEQGDWRAGLRLANQYVKAVNSPEAKSFFVKCVTRAQLTQVNDETLANILRGLDEPWCNPGELTPMGATLVKNDVVIQPMVGKIVQAWPKRLPANELFDTTGLNCLANNALLKAMLVSAAICDIALERLLTTIRKVLLDLASVYPISSAPSNAELDFYCALARQCFINEYVYDCANDEFVRVNALRDEMIAALEQNLDIPAMQLVAVATYFPLNRLPNSERLLQRAWSDVLMEMLIPLVSEPAEERQLRTTVSQLTTIEGEVSLAVQNMYEENPYPRWVKRFFAIAPATLNDLLSSHFPIPFQPLDKERDIEVLVAGCGTGQHSISTALKFKNAHVLAIDLSLSSLSYAKRKSQERGITNVDYAQADIMKLGELKRSFDVIESGGVLHHLADPWAGWRILLSLLRPGGVMCIALYSEMARCDVVRGRELIAQRGYASTLEGIRQCRQELMEAVASEGFARLMTANDFYSASNCRDLLFHVQEHRMTLLQINTFLQENNLVFLGFQEAPETLSAYKKRFPNDPAATNLEQWHIFEAENPYTFIRMYQFWLQKRK